MKDFQNKVVVITGAGSGMVEYTSRKNCETRN